MSFNLKTLVRKDIYLNIPEEDVVSRQKFVLFRIFSLTSAPVCFGVAFKMISTIPDAGYLPWCIIALGGLMLFNLYFIAQLKTLKLSYAIMLSSAMALLHLVSYTCGGIRTGGSIYFAVIILYAYMLLGKKTGRIFTALVFTHIIYLYIISSYTTLTSFDFFKGNIALINEDFLVNALLAFLLIAVQGNYLQGGKNEVIQKLELQKQQLLDKTEALEKTNFNLNTYSADLKKKNTELLKFASIASHDLKAPLRAIGSLTEFIEEQENERLLPESRQHFNLIKGRVRRMEGLINALLDYSLITENKDNTQLIDTENIICNLVGSNTKSSKINIKLEGVFPKLQLNAYLFERLMNILISNAILFNDKSEINISISVTKKNNKYMFTIKDNGPGIDPRFHDKVFEIFQTLQPRDQVETMGAGLAIAKKIVGSWGEDIQIQSSQYSGSSFSFFIPDNAAKKADIKKSLPTDNYTI